MSKTIPKLLDSSQASSILYDMKEQAKVTGETIVISDYVINLIIRMSIQYLLSFIGFVQIVAYASMVNVNTPANVQIYLRIFLRIINTDLLEPVLPMIFDDLEIYEAIAEK